MQVTMRATYTDMWWESDEPDTPESREDGFTDPHNPWGGWKVRTDDEGERINAGDPEWPDAYIEIATFDTLWEAAEFVVDFQGGVWDFREGEYDTVDYRTGRQREVTLHVQNHQEGVFAIAEIIQRMQDKRYARLKGVGVG